MRLNARAVIVRDGRLVISREQRHGVYRMFLPGGSVRNGGTILARAVFVPGPRDRRFNRRSRLGHGPGQLQSILPGRLEHTGGKLGAQATGVTVGHPDQALLGLLSPQTRAAWER